MGYLCGCSNSNLNSSSGEQDGISYDGAHLNVVCTIFPQYDWVSCILGEEAQNMNLTLLLDNGVDLHSYQPTAQDIIKISDADIFIYVGGESDAWVNDVLASASNKNMIVLDLMEILSDAVKEEEISEGMQTEGKNDIKSDSTDETQEIEYDEHVWLSLKNAEAICNAIADALQSLDNDHFALYNANCEKYVAKLSALDHEYEQTVSNAARASILFGDRFPFRYLADDYNLNYYAAFVGCSAETEASFKTITFLAGKIDELDLPVVLTIENSDQKIAQTIINNTQEKTKKYWLWILCSP